MNEAYAGDTVSLIVNVINDTGAHVAATINTATTRLWKAGDPWAATAPTVTTVATGIYQINFAGVTPNTVEGETIVCKVNGTIDGGSAWTEYGVEILIKAVERGTDSVDTSGLATQVELDKVPKKDVAYRYSSATGTSDVTIADTP